MKALPFQANSSQGNYRRLKLCREFTPRLWDTPAPPELSYCQFFHNSKVPYCLRMIALDGLIGLSVFCFDNLIYGIHPHRAREAVPPHEIYNKIPQQRRKTLVWIFLPLSQCEVIEEVWARRGGGPGPGELACPGFVVVPAIFRA